MPFASASSHTLASTTEKQGFPMQALTDEARMHPHIPPPPSMHLATAMSALEQRTISAICSSLVMSHAFTGRLLPPTLWFLQISASITGQHEPRHTSADEPVKQSQLSPVSPTMHSVILSSASTHFVTALTSCRADFPQARSSGVSCRALFALQMFLDMRSQHSPRQSKT